MIPFKEDQLRSAETGMVHISILLLFCFTLWSKEEMIFHWAEPSTLLLDGCVIYGGPTSVGQARFEKQIKNLTLIKDSAFADITDHADVDSEARSSLAMWQLLNPEAGSGLKHGNHDE